MIRVWGRDTSSNVQMVVWALAEIGIEYERVDAGGKYGRLDTPEFLLLNPNRLVPVLEDGELVLWESAAIIRYLAARYGSEQFFPHDPAVRAPLDMWAEWIKTTFGPAFLTHLFWPLVGIREAERDRDAIRAAEARMKPLASTLDARLADAAFLGGNSPCWADTIVGTLLFRYFTLDFDRAETPHLRAYYDRLARHAPYAKHVMVSFESLRVR